MKLLGMFYTHNKLNENLLKAVTERIIAAAEYANVGYGIKHLSSVELVAC